MIEFSLKSRRGGFRLEVSGTFRHAWTVIFGHSGAGKSTLLRLLAGLDRTAGAEARVVLEGRVLTNSGGGLWLPPGRRETALVGQQPALFPHLRVETNVAYGIAQRDRVRARQRVMEMLELVDAVELRSRHPRSLSGGEAQRVALARALAPGPKLLLLDEPLSALDGPAADALLDRLQGWTRQQGIQTVMATHEAADAFATGAEVALLHEGQLAAQGPPEEVLATERARLTARLQGGATTRP